MACNPLHSAGLSHTRMVRSILYLSAASQNVYKTCADPESFVRGGPNLIYIDVYIVLVDEGCRIQKPL